MKISMDFWPRTRSLAQLAALVVSVGGCSIVENVASQAPTYSPYTLYLTTSVPVNLPSELVERYACANHRPLMCTRRSRLGETDCHC